VEFDAFAGETVEGGGVYIPVAVGTHEGVAVVVAEEEEDVGAVSCRGGGRRQGKAKQQDGQGDKETNGQGEKRRKGGGY
jgi:hypothetical protein